MFGLHNFDYLVISAFFFCCDITSVVRNFFKKMLLSELQNVWIKAGILVVHVL